MLGPYSKPLAFVWCCKTCSLSSNWFNLAEVNETVQRYHGQMILSCCYYWIFTWLCKLWFWPMVLFWDPGEKKYV